MFGFLFLDHGAPDVAWNYKNALISLTSQFITYSPAVFIFGILAAFTSLKNKSNKKSEKYILSFALPVLILFAWMSGYQQTLPHWTALGWIALMPLTAKWLFHNWHKKSVRVMSYVSFTYSFVMIITFHLLLSTSLMPFENNKHPLEDIYGWKKVAGKAVELQATMQSEDKNNTPVIFTGNWSQFARLAWYAKPSPVQVTDQRYGQSDIWYGSAKIGSNGVLVVPPKYKDTVTSGLQKFTRCDFHSSVSQEINSKIAATYQLYKCYGLKG